MSDYTKLVEALRMGADYGVEEESVGKLCADAAAAIEELSKTVKDLTTKVECSPMQISEKAFDRAIEAWNERARKEVQDG